MAVYLEYIESSGTQWIDSHFTPDQDTSVEVEYEYTTTSGVQCIYGVRRTSRSQEYEIQLDGGKFYVGYGGALTAKANASANTRYHFLQDKNVLYLNGSVYNTFSQTTFICPYDLALFGIRSGSNNPTYFAKVKFYYLKIWDNGTLVRNFVPAKDDNDVVCLFDRVSSQYYYNQGSGTFTPGPVLSDTYTVQFNDGSGNTATQVIVTGVATPLQTPFAKRDHNLLGWDTSSAGTTVVYTPGQSVTDIAQAGQTINLYAVWRKSWAYLLMDDNGDYYSATQSGATQTLVPLSGISTLTAAVFYGQGFQFLPNNATLRSLSEPTIYLWADDPWTYMDGVVNAIPYPQEIKTEVDLSGAHIIGINEFLISYTGNVNVGYTYDGSTPVSTMTAAAFLALNPDDIYTGLTSAKKLYVFFYLQDENAVLTRFTVNYKRRKFH